MKNLSSLKTKLSIIVPVYNEAATITEILKRVHRVKLPPNLTKEIIVVNDGSNDATKKALHNIRGIKQFHHKYNIGKGLAVRTGLQHAKGDIICIQDADLEYNPQDLLTLIGPILKTEIKVCYGTRLKEYPLRLWGEEKTLLPMHWIANKILSSLVSLIYQQYITDMETCYKVFRKEILKNIQLKSNKFDIEVELTAKILKRGFKILEIPIKVNPRTKNEGKKIKWTDGVFAVWALLKYRFTD